ncbi:hypothetical protein SEA_SNEK_56 [Arthrobacter phage Snek]|uniref:Uncharacterized protein n=1 Tax=Arthrobacter phage Tweety19 TaxID=2768133 RepID=A0A7G9W253_9CAUD|nr:hypothetical protein PQE19_gp52 [Arthrobacter phage Tweety19]QNO12716.1 hypothetical protein SEA_TWEETY19_57 [Arthrobacter phage Tweety19]
MIDEIVEAFAEAFRPFADAVTRLVKTITDAFGPLAPPPPKKKPLIHNGRKPRK